jgi:hypothetical protein
VVAIKRAESGSARIESFIENVERPYEQSSLNLV